MTTLYDHFKGNTLGLTVYSPDTIRSQLNGNIDQFIHDKTSLRPVYRYWIQHTVASVNVFYGGESSDALLSRTLQDYESVPISDLQYGHQVVKLFLTGSSLLTLWHGADAIEQLLTVKGGTQPATAGEGTIRGSFWCDNGVLNLMHCSDSPDELERELRSVDLHHLLERNTLDNLVIMPNPQAKNTIQHSGLLTLIQLINRLLLLEPNTSLIKFELPESGSAIETTALLVPILEHVTQSANTQIASIISDYLAGDLVKLMTSIDDMPVTWWERFKLQCGAITRDSWVNDT